MDDLRLTEEYQEAVYWAELSSPVKGKRAIDELVAKIQGLRLNRPDLREKIEEILEPTLDRLYHQDLPEGKYEEVAIKASVGMLKSNITTQILALYPDEAEIRKDERERIIKDLSCYLTNQLKECGQDMVKGEANKIKVESEGCSSFTLPGLRLTLSHPQ